MEFFAAAYLDAQLREGKSFKDVLSELRFNDQWDEVIEMLAGITERPAELVIWLNKQAQIKQQWHASVLAKRCLVASDALSDLHACVSVIRAPIIAPGLSSETEEIEDIPDEIFESLGAIRDPRAVMPFFQLLRFKLLNRYDGDVDGFYFCESNECHALAQFVYPQAIGPLTAFLDQVKNEGCEENEGLVELVETHLSVIRYCVDKDPLLALECTDVEIRRRAANILGEIGDTTSLPILENIVREDKGSSLFGSVADAARRAIEKIKERHP
jgi:hypothetical protein